MKIFNLFITLLMFFSFLYASCPEFKNKAVLPDRYYYNSDDPVYRASAAFFTKDSTGFPAGNFKPAFELPYSRTRDVWDPCIAIKGETILYTAANNATYLMTDSIYIWRSLDGGRTWDSGRPMFDTVREVMGPPHVRFGDNGYVFALWGWYQTTISGRSIYWPYYSESNDYGLNWSIPKPVVCTTGTTPYYNAKTWWQAFDCEVVNNLPRVVVKYSAGDYEFGDLWFYEPISGGLGNRIWREKLLFGDSSQLGGNFCSWPSIGADDSGRLYVTFTSYSDWDVRLKYRPMPQDTWQDKGRITFNGSTIKEGAVELAHNVPIVNDTARLHFIYVQYTDPSNDPAPTTLYYNYFRFGSFSSQPVIIAQVPDCRVILGTTGKSIVAANDNQSIAVIYGKNTGDPENYSTVHVAYSTNQGQTWTEYGPLQTRWSRRTYPCIEAKKNFHNGLPIYVAWHEAYRIDSLVSGIKILGILSPTGVIPINTGMNPKVIIQNTCYFQDTAIIKFKIHTIYSESIYNIPLLPGQIDTVEFPIWQPIEAAAYIATCNVRAISSFGDSKQGLVSVSSGIGPEIHGRSPVEGPNTGTFTINITGVRFEPGITATLKRYGQPNIIADSITFISSQQINARFNLIGAAVGVWDLKVTNPNGESYYFYQTFTVVAFQGRMIAFGSWDNFGLSGTGDSVVLGVNVPSGLNNLFILLKKSTRIGYDQTWSGWMSVTRSGSQVVYRSGGIDYDAHLRNPASGLYTIKIKTTNYTGQGSIIFCSKLDTLVLGQWRVGRVLRPYGNDWTQVTVPANQTALYFQTEGVGLWSTLDVYYDSLGSTTRHWQFSNMGAGYHIEGRINNPLAGRYYLKYMDSAVMLGDTAQMREYMIRVSTDSIIPPPPSNLSISSLSTYRGGTAGPVTVMISGTGFDTSATVSLVRSGHPTVNASDFYVDSTKRTMWATFDLSSTTPGNWTFKVKNPDGDSAIVQRLFVVEDGGSPDIKIEIIGRNVIRVGRPSTYIVRCSNQGNINAPYTFIIISTRGDSNNLLRMYGLWFPPDAPPWLDSFGQTAIIEGSRTAVICVTCLPPGQTASLEGDLTMWNTGPTLLSVIGRSANIYGFLGVQSALAELIRHNVLSDTMLSPSIRSAASDSTVWWNLLMSYMNEYGVVHSNNDFNNRNVLISTMIDIAITLLGKKIHPALPVLLKILEVLLKLRGDAPPPFAGWQPPPPYPGYEPPQYMNDIIEKISQLSGVGSSTPEDKYGPVGFDLAGTQLDSLKRFVTSENSLYSYRIDFWNHESASAPAQEVFLKDTLNMDFIDSTFNFTEFGFLRWTVPLSGGNYFNTYVDMRSDDSLIVNVEGSYDQNSREISWTFRSLNPITMQPPEDPMAGFLPPIDSTGYQIGWVNFTAQPRPNLQTGHKITNQSWVKFDVGHWKPAPESGPYLNTIDAGRPSSQVRLISDTTATGEFIVKWSGQDDSLGSGIRSYNIYVKTDNGTYRLWLSNTTDTMATFVGRNESRHYFYSIATDKVGWVEPPPDSFDACTFVTGIAPPIYRTPQNNSIVTDATPTFIWSATASSQGNYTLQYSCDSSFVQGTITISGLTDTTYTVPDTFALIDSIYFWRAEAISRLNVHSGYRQAFRFTVDANAPVPPILLSPLNNSITTDSTPSFIWSKTAGDSGRYLIQFATDSLFDSLKGAALTFDTIYTVPNSYPLPDTVYYWRIRAIDRAHNFSGWSLAWRFEIDTRIPVAPVLVEPIQGVWQNDTNVVFQWTTVTLGKEVKPQITQISTEEFSATTNEHEWTQISIDEPSEVTSPVRYILQVDTNRNFISPLRVDSTSASYDTFNLSERKYFWRVRAYDLAGNQGIFSGQDSFGVDITSPSIVSLISPSNNNYLNDSTINLIWYQASDNLSGIQHYIVQYAFDSIFTQGLVDTISNDTTFTMTLADSTYYWRTRAIDRAGNEGNWSSVFSFEIDTRIPNAPVLTSPINGIWLTNTSVIFNWSQVTFEKEKNKPQITQISTDNIVGQDNRNLKVAATSDPLSIESDFFTPVRYILQADTNTNFTTPIVNTTSFVYDTLTLNQARYYWRVRAYDLAGNQGIFSGCDSFGVDNTAPSIPNLVSPANGLITNNPNVTFIWNRSTDNLSGVLRYTIEYASDSGFSNPTDTIVTDTTITLILTDTTYYWRVKSQDKVSNQSGWSISQSFEVDTGIPNAPVLISPINGIWVNNINVIFNWSPVTIDAKSPVRYIIQVDTSTNFTSSLIDTTSYLCDTLTLVNARYNWRVRAYDLSGNQGAFSNRDSFGADNTAPGIPNLISPVNNTTLTDSFVRFYWNHSTDNVSGVRNYLINIANNSNFNNAFDTTLSDTTILRRLTDTTYYWKVKAIDIANNQSDWSNVWNFRIQTTGIEEIESVQIPLTFSLFHNKPNPFSRLTEIRYGIPYTNKINISIFSPTGEEIIRLVNNTHNPGWYSVRWNGKDSKGKICPNGIYFYRLVTSEYQATRKMLMLR